MHGGWPEAAGQAVIEIESLQVNAGAALFEGARLGGVPVLSFIITHPPGGGPKLPVHPDPQVFIMLSGQVTFQVGDQVVEAGGGQIVIAPAETPHRFRNTGSTSMSMVSIQPNGAERIPPVHDPEIRHGRKSASKRFDGHGPGVAVATDEQLITAVDKRGRAARETRTMRSSWFGTVPSEQRQPSFNSSPWILG